MTDKFKVEIFEEWQKLIASWEATERELMQLEAAQDNPEAGEHPRKAKLREELARLKTEIDELVLRMSKNRDPKAAEMVVALVDTKPEGTSLASMVRERFSRLGSGR